MRILNVRVLGSFTNKHLPYRQKFSKPFLICWQTITDKLGEVH